MRHASRTLLFLIVVLISTNSRVYSQFIDKGVGAGTLGLARSGVAYQQNAFSSFLNPALNTPYSDGEVSTYYTRLFNLSDLSQFVVGYSRPFKQFGFALGFESFGNSIYRENRLLINVNRAVRKDIRVGLGVNVYNLSIDTFGSTSTFGGDVGILYRPDGDVSFGFRWHNFNSPGIGVNNAKIPDTITLGTTVQLIPEVVVLLDVVREDQFRTQIRFGQETQIADYLTLRLGLGREPSTFSSGFGVLWKSFVLDYSFVTHPSLGLTHSLSVSFVFSERKTSDGSGRGLFSRFKRK